MSEKNNDFPFSEEGRGGIHVAHLNKVYDKAKFCTGGWGKPTLIYRMIERLSIIVNFNDRQKVKDNI